MAELFNVTFLGLIFGGVAFIVGVLTAWGLIVPASVGVVITGILAAFSLALTVTGIGAFLKAILPFGK